MMEQAKIPATESVLEAVERFVAEDKLIADSAEDEEYFDDEEEEDGDSTVDEAAAGTAPAVSAKVAVQVINKIALQTVERGKMEIGEYLLDAIFRGNVEEVLSRNPYKCASLKEISEDPDLRVDRRRLGTWVKAAALARDLQANGLECSSLGISQLAVLLRVKNAEKRKELAIEALGDGLSMRQLLTRVEEMKSHAGSSGRQKLLCKKIEDPMKLLGDEETRNLLSDQERLAGELQTRERLDLVTVIDKIGGQMDETRRFLKQVKSNLVRIELADCEVAED